nr:unnamed protein product [Naegleria fowleri]
MMIVTDFSNQNHHQRNVSFISPGMLDEYGEEEKDRAPLDAREIISRIKTCRQLEEHHDGITLFKDPLNHLIYGTTNGPHRKKFQHRWNSTSMTRMKRRTAQPSASY